MEYKESEKILEDSLEVLASTTGDYTNRVIDVSYTPPPRTDSENFRTYTGILWAGYVGGVTFNGGGKEEAEFLDEILDRLVGMIKLQRELKVHSFTPPSKWQKFKSWVANLLGLKSNSPTGFTISYGGADVPKWNDSDEGGERIEFGNWKSSEYKKITVCVRSDKSVKSKHV